MWWCSFPVCCHGGDAIPLNQRLGWPCLDTPLALCWNVASMPASPAGTYSLIQALHDWGCPLAGLPLGVCFPVWGITVQGVRIICYPVNHILFFALHFFRDSFCLLVSVSGFVTRSRTFAKCNAKLFRSKILTSLLQRPHINIPAPQCCIGQPVKSLKTWATVQTCPTCPTCPHTPWCSASSRRPQRYVLSGASWVRSFPGVIWNWPLLLRGQGATKERGRASI